jgi:hypothetical protein
VKAPWTSKQKYKRVKVEPPKHRKAPPLAEVARAFIGWAKLVEGGADPIEAFHGHVCSPSCWHQQGVG